MKKVILLLTFVGLIFYVSSAFFYIDIEREDFCVIKVLPSFLISNLDTKGALKLIKHASPADYDEVCKRVRVINKNPGCGGLDGGCFYENKPSTIYIGNDQSNIAFAADLILHENCHARQFAEGRTLNEPECYKIGKVFLDSITAY